MSPARELDAYYYQHVGHNHTSWGSSNGSSASAVVIREWEAESNRLGIHFYATFGMSLDTLRGASSHGNELYSGVSQASASYREALATLATNARNSCVTFQDCQILDLDFPVIDGLGFTGWIFFDRSKDLLPVLDLSNGAHVLLLDTAPIFTSEVEHAQNRGVDSLLDVWTSEGTEIWDLSRTVPLGLGAPGKADK